MRRVEWPARFSTADIIRTPNAHSSLSVHMSAIRKKLSFHADSREAALRFWKEAGTPVNGLPYRIATSTPMVDFPPRPPNRLSTLLANFGDRTLTCAVPKPVVQTT